MAYAEGTTVSIEKSQAEIQTMIRKYGASDFATGQADDMKGQTIAFIAFSLKRSKGPSWMVRFNLAMPDRKDKTYTHVRSGSASSYRPRTSAQADAVYDAECKRRWRCLVLCIKSKLEAVATGITTAETEFMAHVVMPDGRPFGEHAVHAIADTYETGHMPRLVLLPPPKP